METSGTATWAFPWPGDAFQGREPEVCQERGHRQHHPACVVPPNAWLLSRQFAESLLHFDSGYQREKSIVDLNKQIACSLPHVLIVVHTAGTSGM